MKFSIKIILLIFSFQIGNLYSSFLSNRSLQGSTQQIILQESNYDDCYDYTSDDPSLNKWTLYDLDLKSTVFIPECTNLCGSFGNILGPFSSNVGLIRQIEIDEAHTEVIIKAGFIQIDGWSLGQQLIMNINDQIVYSWEYNGADAGDINECDYALIGKEDHLELMNVNVEHTNNMLNVLLYTINSNSELVNMWALKTFEVEAVNCNPQQNAACKSISPVSFSVETFSNSKPTIKPYIQIRFDRAIETILTTSYIDIVIEDVDQSLYSFSLSQVGSDQILYEIHFDQMNFSTHYGQSLQLTFTKQIRDSQGMALLTSTKEVDMPSYFNYSSDLINILSSIKSIVQGTSSTIMLFTAVLTFAFDKFNWLFYSTDIGQILYLSTFINVKFPQNVQQVLYQGCSVFLLQDLPDVFQTQISSQTIQSQTPYFQHFQDLGMNSLFLSNAGNIFALIIIFHLTFAILQILASSQWILKEQQRKTISQFLQKRFKWRLFFAMGYFLYAQALFAALIQIFTWEFGSAISILSYILTFLSLILGFIFPFGMYKLIKQNLQKVLNDNLDPNFTMKFGIAWQDLKKPENDGSQRTIFFYFFLLLRRCLYACIVVLFQFNANLQIALLNICNVTVIFVVMFQMPFVKKRKNYKIIMTEFILICEYMVMQSYQDEQEDEETRINRGWIIVFATLLILFIQILFISIDVFEPIIAFIKSKYLQLQILKTQRRQSKLSINLGQEKVKSFNNEENVKENQLNQPLNLQQQDDKYQTSIILPSAMGNANKNGCTPMNGSSQQFIQNSQSRLNTDLSFTRRITNRLSIDTTNIVVKKELSQMKVKVSENTSTQIGNQSTNVNTPVTVVGNTSELHNSNAKHLGSNKSIKIRQSFSNNQLSSNQLDYQAEVNDENDDYNLQVKEKQTIPDQQIQGQQEQQNVVNQYVKKEAQQKTIRHQQSNQSNQSNSFQMYEGSYYIPQNQFQDQISTNNSHRQKSNELSNTSNLNIQPKLSYEEDSFINRSSSPNKGSYSFQGIRTNSDQEITIKRKPQRNLSLFIQHQHHFLSPETGKRIASEEDRNDDEEDNQLPPPRFLANPFIAGSNQTIQEQPGEENGSIMGLSQPNIHSRMSIQDSPLEVPSTNQVGHKVLQLLRNYPGGQRNNTKLIKRDFTNIEEENEDSNMNSNSIIINGNISEKDFEKSLENINKSKQVSETIKKFGLQISEDSPSSSKEGESPRTSFLRMSERKKSQFAKYNSEQNLEQEQIDQPQIS